MPDLCVTQLGRDEIEAAFPLVRLAAPKVDPARWREHAEQLIRDSGGLIGVFAGDTRLHGLAAYRPDRSLRHGRTLRVEILVTLELSQKAPVRAALFETLELIADAMACDSLTVELEGGGYADPRSARGRSWAATGLEPESVTLVKELSTTAGADGVRGS